MRHAFADFVEGLGRMLSGTPGARGGGATAYPSPAGHQIHAERPASTPAPSLEDLHRACRLGAEARARLALLQVIRGELMLLSEDSLTAARARWQLAASALATFDRESEHQLARFAGERARLEAQLYHRRGASGGPDPAVSLGPGGDAPPRANGCGTAAPGLATQAPAAAAERSLTIAELEGELERARVREQICADTRPTARQPLQRAYEQAAEVYLGAGLRALIFGQGVESDLERIVGAGDAAASQLGSLAGKEAAR